MAEQTKKKVPHIRFKDFSDGWLDSSLADLAFSLSGGAAVKPEDYLDAGVRTVPKGAVNSTGIADLIGSKFVSKEFFTLNISSKVTTGDLITSLRDLVPSAPNMGRIVKIVGEQEDFLMPQGVYKLTLHGNVDENFVISKSNSDQFRKVISREKNGSTQVHIRNSEFLSIRVFTPSHSEQTKIGTYFAELDQMIRLHQRKHEKLVSLKKAMLQKMFPQNGNTPPPIRFKGFSEPWEEKKLSDISIKVTEKNAANQYSETFTNSAEYGIVSQRDYFDKDISNSENIGGYYVVKDNDFVYNPRISSFAPVGPMNRNRLGRTGVMSPLYTVFRTYGVDNTFLEYFFKTDCWHRFMFSNGDTGARADRFSIKDSVFIELPIPCPLIAEQQKVGTYFRQLDELIAQHRTQVEKLQQIKISCLEKMFV